MAIVVAFMLVLLGLLAVGWYARRRRQSAMATPATVPSDPGTFVGQFAGKYVATTVSGDPFDRIAVHGLGFRGSVEVTVTVAGLVVRIAGGERNLDSPGGPARHPQSQLDHRSGGRD